MINRKRLICLVERVDESFYILCRYAFVLQFNMSNIYKVSIRPTTGIKP